MQHKLQSLPRKVIINVDERCFALVNDVVHGMLQELAWICAQIFKAPAVKERGARLLSSQLMRAHLQSCIVDRGPSIFAVSKIMIRLRAPHFSK
jgi:hypothetical protein